MFIFAQNIQANEKNLLIELLETGEKVSLYSPRFEGEEFTEFERFLLTYKNSYTKDVQILIRRLDIIKEMGAEDRFFRYEGSKQDRVMALPLEKKKIITIIGTNLNGPLEITINTDN